MSIQMEQTYIMIKPDGVQRGLIGKIISRIENRGLKIVAMKMAIMKEEAAKEHYAEHAERPFFKSLIDYIIAAPSISMIVEGKNAISIMRKINGATNPVDADPGTIRGDFAIEMGRNLVHASDSKESSIREIAIHFNESEIIGYKKSDEEYIYE